ncbi:MAG: serine/threonine protein kinase, partial [Polyangiaceae bacterium]|nr:serine/threonine protein kinase [Polyangiaceae bacterium]
MAARRPTLSMGQVLGGRYRIEAAIGEGGWGSVYRALCREGGYVAVKLLHTRLAERSVSRKRFEREAALLARLEHPNVVRLLDAGHADDGAPYLVFELLYGESLRDCMRREGAVAPERAGGIALEVLAGLDAAHGLGIVHRDVKPPNVFLCRDAAGAAVRARLLDFGIAKAIGSEESHHTKLTETGQMLGSPAYMAPEQVRGGEVGPRADLYALGLVLAELVGGERIVRGESGVDIILSHVADAPHVLPEAVRRSPLGPVVERAIRKAPEERYGSAREMAAAIGAALAPRPHAQPAEPRPVAVAPAAVSAPSAAFAPPVPLAPLAPVAPMGLGAPVAAGGPGARAARSS